MVNKTTDEFLAVIGTDARPYHERARRAIVNGVPVVDTPFISVIASSGASLIQRISTDHSTGCIVDGHMSAPPEINDAVLFFESSSACGDGFYNLLFWDAAHKEARIQTDACGFRALYYWEEPAGKTVVLGSHLRLICAVITEVWPNSKAFVEQLAVSAALGDRTLVTGINRLRPDVELRVSARGISKTRLRRTEMWGNVNACLSVSAAAELIVHVIDEVIRDWVSAPAVRIALSGGYDSRLLAIMARRIGAEVSAVTLGTPAWVDQKLGSRVATELDLPHRAVRPPTQVTFNEYLEGVARTEHVADYMSGFWIEAYAQEVGVDNVPILNGFLGGPVSGAALNWTSRSAVSRGDVVRAWLRHVNQANVPFALMARSISGAPGVRAMESNLRHQLDEYYPHDLPTFQAVTALEFSVRQFGFVSLGTLGVYRRFSRPLTPFADNRIIRLFGQMALPHLANQAAYRAAIDLVDNTRAPFASTSGRTPATFALGPRKTIERGFARLAADFREFISGHAANLADLLDARFLLKQIDAATKAPTGSQAIPQTLMLLNAAALWLLFSGRISCSGNAHLRGREDRRS